MSETETPEPSELPMAPAEELEQEGMEEDVDAGNGDAGDDNADPDEDA